MASSSKDCNDEDESEVTGPVDIQIESHDIVDVCFHPSKDVIAAGTIEGDIFLHSYTSDKSSLNNQLLTLSHHKKACRGIEFSADGNLLFSISKDKTLQAVDMNTGSVTHKIPKAHESAIHSLLIIDEYLAATGDDEGVLKVWDYRRRTAIMEEKHMEEYVSSMAINDEKKILLATSGEGTLTAFNIRAKRMELQSELFDSEMTSLAIVKRGSKVVVGCGEGVLNIFNWGEWGNISDRFPGHPDSIDCIVPITENIICTGSMDGKIRAVNILPNRFIGVVGEHAGLPIESLSVSNDRVFLASCSHDHLIKFWPVSYLQEEEVSDKKKAKRSNKNKNLQSSKNQNDFFADMNT